MFTTSLDKTLKGWNMTTLEQVCLIPLKCVDVNFVLIYEFARIIKKNWFYNMNKKILDCSFQNNRSQNNLKNFHHFIVIQFKK